MKKSKGKKVKKILQKVINILTAVLVAVFLIGGTIFAIYYGKGYRFNLQESTIEKTGVLSVSSNPSQALLSVNDEEKGLTPKTVGSLKEGLYTVSVEKTGYHNWEKTLPIKAELSTPYLANLFLSEPLQSTLFEIPENEEVLEYQLSENQNQIYMLTQEFPEEENESALTPSRSVKIYAFTVNETFLNFTDNPQIIFDDTLDEYQVINLEPSRTGDYLAVTIASNDKDGVEVPTQRKTYLVDTTTAEEAQIDDLPELSLELFYDYDIKWTKTDNYMLISSPEEIFSFNVTNNATILIQKGVQNIKGLIYYIDSSGNFYYLNHVQEEEQAEETEESGVSSPSDKETISYYQIIQKNLNGTNEEPFIEEILYSSDPERLETLKNLSRIQETTFAFSAENAKNYLTGEIRDFTVHPEGAGIFLSTSLATYWYNTETSTYTVVELAPTQFVDFSPDLKNFSYLVDLDSSSNEESSDIQNSVALKVFTFEKEPIDHLTSIGSKEILTITSENKYFTSKENFKWLSNSSNISFLEFLDENNLSLTFIDIDGENRNSMISIPLKSIPSSDISDFIYSVSYQNEDIITFEARTPEEQAQEPISEALESEDMNPENIYQLVQYQIQ
ncbi:PEGA domain-containing protein [Candidatus Dojkabacteria bacterium]|nr:PEGA domain-containing protein [Candidatus Dojkabacteria bacterium]